MIKMLRWLAWGLVALLLAAVLDQTLLRVPLRVPVVAELQQFYIDFRARLIGISGAGRGDGSPVAERIDAEAEKTATAPGENAPRYLYVDETGALQFADRLEDIPPAYRREARELER